MFANLVDRIDALLPQTQCTKCGHVGCRPYAQAIAAGTADIDQCPPGGAIGIAKLAALLGREIKPLNPAYGVEQPRAAALIDERWCIGCTLCIDACPVDAIVGAPKRMHTVLLEHCTGCELCLPPCPVDCIQLVGLDELARQGAGIPDATVEQRATKARRRYHLRQERRGRERSPAQRVGGAEDVTATVHYQAPVASSDTERRREAVRAALQRARARRASRQG